MKQILGDNQFFGINHHDLEKGGLTKERFGNREAIVEFIREALGVGLNGFMINSNDQGFKVVSEIQVENSIEIHYSVPYPHRFANMVNENGMIYLFRYVWEKSTYTSLLLKIPQFIFTRDIKDILPLILDLEIPKNLPKGSYIYLQNIITDLAIGLKRCDLLLEFCEIVLKKGYKPGLISLNPIVLEKYILSFPEMVKKDLIVCFNINKTGFNVFPSKEEVEKFVNKSHPFMKMGMSILSSGGTNNILDSLEYIKQLPLDYVVYGSSKIDNIRNNFNQLKK